MPLSPALTKKLMAVQKSASLRDYCADETKGNQRSTQPHIVAANLIKSVAIITDTIQNRALVQSLAVSPGLYKSELTRFYGYNTGLFSRDWSTEKILETVGAQYFGGDKVKKILGAGEYGAVFLVQEKGTGKTMAVKMTRGSILETTAEEYAQRKFSHMGLAPRVYKSSFFGTQKNNLSVVYMEKIDYTLNELLCRATSTSAVRKLVHQTVTLVEKLYVAGLTHGDLHSQNIGFTYNDLTKQYDAVAIDFGFTDWTESNITKDVEALVTIFFEFQYPHTIEFATALQAFYDRHGLPHKVTSTGSNLDKVHDKYVIRRKRNIKADKVFTKYMEEGKNPPITMSPDAKPGAGVLEKREKARQMYTDMKKKVVAVRRRAASATKKPAERKSCPPGWVRNPATGRCRKKCLPGQVRGANGRCKKR